MYFTKWIGLTCTRRVGRAKAMFAVLVCITALSADPGTQQRSTTLQLSTPQVSRSALRKPQLVAARSTDRHELSRPRQKQLTVLAVAFALCNDVLLLLMLVPMLVTMR